MPFIVDRNIRESLVESLKKYDPEIYFSYLCDKVYPPVNTHPDIQIHFVNSTEAFTAPEFYEYYKNILPERVRLHKGNKSLGGTYPGDVAYNISRIGNNVILNINYADEKAVNYYKSYGFNIINVKQGYSKCSICTDGKYALTEDDGIYKALIKNNISALKIKYGGVRLSGFDYGFIGGASGYIKSKLLFCGDIEGVPNYKAIKDFFAENNTEIIALDENELEDYGSIIYFE